MILLWIYLLGRRKKDLRKTGLTEDPNISSESKQTSKKTPNQSKQKKPTTKLSKQTPMGL